MTNINEEHREVEEERRYTYIEERAEPNPVARKVIRVVWILAVLVYGLLGFRFLLKLFSANPDNPFAVLVYSITDIFIWPFQNLLANPTFRTGIIEVTTLIAILVYIFLTWLVIQLALLLFKR